jgi:hypothetical protein
MLGREKEMVLQGERHLQNRGRRRTLESQVFFLSYARSLCFTVSHGRKGREAHRHQQRWMRLQTGFKREFLLVSALSGTVSGSGTWLVDSGATCHMTGARELFESFTESDSDLYVELGMGTKHAVQGSGTVSF